MAFSGAPTDELDFQIIRELLISTNLRARPDRARLEEVAAALKVHVNTVVARIRRMEKHRLFLPFTLQVGPPIGLQYASAFFPLKHRITDEQRDQLFALGPVNVVVEYVEGFVLLLHAIDQQAIEAALAGALRVVPDSRAEVETAGWLHLPKMDVIPLKRSDPDILREMAKDPRRSAQDIATSLSLSPRTVEQRLEEIRGAKGIAMMLGGDAVPTGMAMGHIIVDVEAGPTRESAVLELSRLCPNYFYRSVGPTRIFFALYASSTAALLEQADRVQAISGVSVRAARILTRWTANPRFPDYLKIAAEEARGRKTTATRRQVGT